MRIHNAKIAAGIFILAMSASLLWNARAGHERTAESAFVLGRPFNVEVGKAVVLPTQKLRVTFERVTEDSRCPAGVDCVWAGQVGVVIGLKQANKNLGMANLIIQGSANATPKSVGKIGPYWIKLTNVAPEKGAPDDSRTAQRITLIVQDKAFETPKNGG